MNNSSIRFLWDDPKVVKRFRTGASLHSHTLHSREPLNLLLNPHMIARISGAIGLNRETEIFWTPPLSAHASYDLERSQIEDVLGLRAMVSLTDHDRIDAAADVQLLDSRQRVPISVEWTVPFGATAFHLGVHNLPHRRARAIMAVLAEYTANPRVEQLPNLLRELHSCPQVLIVFNHPFWDEAGIGEAAHIAIVKRFLAQNGVWIHALELNGLRRWSENRRVIELAQLGRYPLISGGDRHGCEPSAVINLTDARSFDEFVAEIRCDRVSDVLFLPRYRFSPVLRIADMVCDALREYPQQVGREHFSDRVFCCVPGESERPLSSYWNGAEPLPIRLLMRAVKLFKRHSDWAMPQQSVRAPREISQSAR